MPKEFDVALSFAGEDREYVDPVAKLLRASGVRVFYDRFEEKNLWGKNLYDYLSDIYMNKARYTIMFISKHYAKKLWTTLEREAMQARAFEKYEEYILPARFDDTPIPGILPTVGHISLVERPVAEFVNIVLEKLGIALDPPDSHGCHLLLTAHDDFPARIREALLKELGNHICKAQDPGVSEEDYQEGVKDFIHSSAKWLLTIAHRNQTSFFREEIFPNLNRNTDKKFIFFESGHELIEAWKAIHSTQGAPIVVVGTKGPGSVPSRPGGRFVVVLDRSDASGQCSHWVADRPFADSRRRASGRRSLVRPGAVAEHGSVHDG